MDEQQQKQEQRHAALRLRTAFIRFLKAVEPFPTFPRDRAWEAQMVAWFEQVVPDQPKIILPE